MKEEKFRNQITSITFVFSVLVVMIHAYNISLYTQVQPSVVWQLVQALEDMVSDVLGPVAVPGFFMLSAYLFYRNFSWNRLPGKWNSRIRSVLVPYVVWNSLYYFGYVIFRNIPSLQPIVGQGKVGLSVGNLADAIIHFSYNPVFWYLQQLIILIALAPVIYVLLSHLYIGTGFLCLIAFLIYKRIDGPWLNMDALFYYSVAAFLALHGKSWVEKQRSRYAWLLLLGMSVVCYWTYTATGQVLYLVCFRLFVPGVVWLFLCAKEKVVLRPWMSHGFFLYASHFIFVRALNKLLALLLPHTAWWALLVWLLLPVLTVLVIWKIGICLQKKSPPLWSLLSGGRN